jgi:choline kinase
MLRGIILAAGRGARLNGALDETPKCLMRLGGTSMLERQIQALRGAGIDEIAVVVGHGADRVRRVAGGAVHYVENARFAQTNSLYSLWLARPLLLDGFVVLNCDVLFHPQLLTDLLTARCDAAALVAYRTDGETLGEEEMKVRVRRGRVVEFSKQMPPAEADGENVGMLKFHAPAARPLVERLDRLVATAHTQDWAPRAFGEFAGEHSLYAIATRGYPWIEIDFPEDYERAREAILPAIERIPTGLPGTVPFDPLEWTATGDAAWPPVLVAPARPVEPPVTSAKQ